MAELTLRACRFQFSFPRPAILMGIVNVTPDSFSDGGRFMEPSAAIEHGMRLAEEGAEILDIGGESTRPNAEPVSEAEELRRVLPVVQGLVGRVNALISIDTSKPAVAREAVRAGAAMINDIGAAHQDPVMWDLARESGAAYVAMHMQGTPRTMQREPVYRDVCREVGVFFADRLAKLAERGVPAEQIVLDVGIGFGKTLEHNLQLLRHLRDFNRLNRPMMIGVSRKSFLGRVSGAGPLDRLPAALAVSCWAAQCGVQMIRTHDVAPTLQAIRMAEEIWRKHIAET